MNRKKTDYGKILEGYIDHPEVLRMKEYCAHGNKSVYDHCLDVVEASFLINEKLGLKADPETLAKGALLHDMYLYDWHDRPLSFDIFSMHGFTHPSEACRNAVKVFGVDEGVQKVIRSHMWPLTFRSFPSSREALIVCVADKWCALKETFKRW